MAFPADKLAATGGEIYCQVYENVLTGLPLDLYWSASIDFAPLPYCGDSLKCSATVEWFRIPQRNFRAINELQIRIEGDDPVVESSFYMSRHDIAKQTSLSLSYLGRDKFRLALDMTVDFLGYDDGDADPSLRVAGETDITYTGLIVVPGNLNPKPEGESEVAALAGTYVDIDCYERPLLQGFRYVLIPRHAG